MGVSENKGVPDLGVRIIRILLFGVTISGPPIFGNPQMGRQASDIVGGGGGSSRASPQPIVGSDLTASCWSRQLALHDATQTTDSSKQIPQRMDEALISKLRICDSTGKKASPGAEDDEF